MAIQKAPTTLKKFNKRVKNVRDPLTIAVVPITPHIFQSISVKHSKNRQHYKTTPLLVSSNFPITKRVFWSFWSRF